MSINRLDHLLKKFSQNTISQSEFEELMNSVKREDADMDLIRALDEEWKRLKSEDLPGEKENPAVYERIISDRRFKAAEKKTARIKSISYRIVAAASVLLICSGAFFFHRYQQRQINTQSLEQRIVQAGEKVRLRLSDGTTVWINSASRLQFPAAFTEKNREVRLDGEAYFDVAHNPEKPFIIHTEGIKIKVLGTAFNVTAYEKDKIRVAVSNGRVRVSDGQKKLAELTRNTQLEYNSTTHRMALSTVDADETASWISGSLVLNNVTLQEAADRLERWYNVKITFNHPQSKLCRFSAAFLNNEKLGKVLEVICRLNGLNYEINKQQIVISGKGC